MTNFDRNILVALGLFLAVEPRLSAQVPQPPAPLSVISTHATAHRRLPNTVADVSVAIETEGKTVAMVTKVLASKSQDLTSYLKREGADRLTTDQVSVETKTHTVKGGPDTIVGYSGRLSVSFRSTPEKVSELIGGALAAGANTLQQVTFSPREEELDAARQQLATAATRTAVAQAEAVAQAAGARITGVREIIVDPENATMRPMSDSLQSSRAATFASAAAAPVPIATSAGDQDVSISVEVRVDIAR